MLMTFILLDIDLFFLIFLKSCFLDWVIPRATVYSKAFHFPRMGIGVWTYVLRDFLFCLFPLSPRRALNTEERNVGHCVLWHSWDKSRWGEWVAMVKLTSISDDSFTLKQRIAGEESMWGFKINFIITKVLLVSISALSARTEFIYNSFISVNLNCFIREES